MPPHLYWGLVQLVERQILTLKVKGSSPLPPASWIQRTRIAPTDASITEPNELGENPAGYIQYQK